MFVSTQDAWAIISALVTQDIIQLTTTDACRNVTIHHVVITWDAWHPINAPASTTSRKSSMSRDVSRHAHSQLITSNASMPDVSLRILANVMQAIAMFLTSSASRFAMNVSMENAQLLEVASVTMVTRKTPTVFVNPSAVQTA